MRHSGLLALVVGFSLIFTAMGQTSGDIPFSSAGIGSLPGKDICHLQGEFPKQFGLYLDDKKERSVEYRERDGVICPVSIGNVIATKTCGIVDAALDLTRLIRKGEDPRSNVM
jgi:hypothetical protein